MFACHDRTASRHWSRRAALAATASLLATGSGRAAAWPERPVRLILALGPGSTADIVARLVAAPLSTEWKQPVVIEPRPGAGGTIAGEAVARAAPDGYTLGVFTVQSHAVAPAMYPKTAYHPTGDFTHLGMLAEIPLVLAVPVGSPSRTLGEFVTAARASATGFTVGTNGNGSSAHVTLGRLARLAGIQLTHVPYRGSNAPAIADLLGGRLDAVLPSLGDVARNDQVRMLAVSSAERLARWPEVPTFREQGFPDMVSTVWFSVAAPAGLPEPIAETLHRDLLAAVQRGDVAERLAELGSIPGVGLTRAALTDYVGAESERWGGIVRAIGIRAE